MVMEFNICEIQIHTPQLASLVHRLLEFRTHGREPSEHVSCVEQDG